MKNRVYYGEYSLAYWIELILAKKIVLPKYQRHFVWSESRLNTLISTLKENRFVPPVTIGSFRNETGKFNYIIDGQQRLTCILLAYLELFPDKDGFRSHLLALADGTAQLLEDGADPYDNVMEWNFGMITSKGRTKAEIQAHVEPGNYKTLQLNLDVDFWKNTFLGFSYIVPDDSIPAIQQQYYTKVFREINLRGVNLLAIESRKSLYFLNENLETYFEPSFANNYKVRLVGETQQMDFTRYLCFMAAYKKHNNVNMVARGYGYCMEEYIEKYIYSVVDNANHDMFGDFNTIFPNGEFAAEMNRFAQTLQDLDLPTDYPSIINMDTYFFGLIYHVLFCHRTIDTSRKDALKEQIETDINTLKNTGKHSQSPAQFQYMRARITKSINTFNTYLLP